MAGATLSSRVLTEFDANTKPEERALKRRDKARKKSHEEAKKQSDTEERALTRSIAQIGKAALAVASLGAAWGTARESLDSYLTNARLAAQTQKADIDGLRKSFRGLIETTDVMRFAAQTMNSRFRANNTEMQIGARFALLLAERTGRDLKESFEAVKKAMIEANPEPLKEWGVIWKTQNETAQGYRDILRGMKDELSSAGQTGKLVGQDIRQAAVSAKDGMDDLKSAIGEMVTALEPAFKFAAGAFRQLALMIKQPREELEQFGSALLSLASGGRLGATHDFQTVGKAKTKDLRGLILDAQAERQLRGEKPLFIPNLAGNPETSNRILKPGTAIPTPIVKQLVALQKAFKVRTAGMRIGQATADLKDQGTFPGLLSVIDPIKAPKLGGGASKRARSQPGALTPELEALILQSRLDDFSESRIAVTGGLVSANASPLSGVNSAGVSLVGGFAGASGRGPRFDDAVGKLALAPEKSFLDPTIKSLGSAEQAAQSFGAAFKSTVGAVITGSKSLGSAIKEAMGQVIMAKALDMFATAASEGVMAVVSLARLDFRGAAVHGKAAFAAGAAGTAIAAMARILGVGTRAPAGAASGGANFGAGLSANGGGSSTVVLLGSDFVSRSRREQATEMRQLIALADREQGHSVVRHG